MPDLSTSGVTLPLLIAAAVAGALHWYSGRTPAAPKADPGPAPAAGPFNWLADLMNNPRVKALLPVLLTLWKNKDAVISMVSAFLANLKKLVTHPDDAKPKGT